MTARRSLIVFTAVWVLTSLAYGQVTLNRPSRQSDGGSRAYQSSAAARTHVSAAAPTPADTGTPVRTSRPELTPALARALQRARSAQAEQETAKQETAKQETAKQETAKQEKAKQEKAKQEKAEQQKAANADTSNHHTAPAATTYIPQLWFPNRRATIVPASGVLPKTTGIMQTSHQSAKPAPQRPKTGKLISAESSPTLLSPPTADADIVVASADSPQPTDAPFLDLRNQPDLSVQAAPHESTNTELFIQLAVWTVIILCSCFLVVLGIRYVQRRQGLLPQNDQEARVLQTLSLGAHRTVSLVQLGDVRAVVGCDSTGVSNIVLASSPFEVDLINGDPETGPDVPEELFEGTKLAS